MTGAYKFLPAMRVICMEKFIDGALYVYQSDIRIYV